MEAFRAKYLTPGNIIEDVQVLDPFEPDILKNELGESIETIEDDHPDINLTNANTRPDDKPNTYFQHFNIDITKKYSECKLEWIEDTYDEYIHEHGADGAGAPMTKFEFLAQELAEVAKFYEYVSSEVFSNTAIRKVFTNIDYPVTRECNMCFTIKEDVPITFGVLMYLHHLSYQLMYKLDKVVNCNGDRPYGICAHAIGDLIYNGSRKIDRYADGISCNFGCDS